MNELIFSATDLAEISEALAFSANAHSEQRRKDSIGTPYINHPIDLFRTLSFLPSTTKTRLIGCILHDVVEDTTVTSDNIKIRFGEEVANLVMEVTNDKTLTSEDSKLHELERAKTLSLSAALIRIADKISNIGDINKDQPVKWDLERKIKYCKWAKQLVENITIEHEDIKTLKFVFFQTYYKTLDNLQ